MTPTSRPEPEDNAPPYPGVRLRPIRVEDELWQESLDTARERGETVSGVVRDFLRDYIAKHKARKVTDE